MLIKQITQIQAWDLRHAVMWPDKPYDYIKLQGDETALHYGLFHEDELKSVISLFIEDGECQFRKFATLEGEQGKGYGSRLLEHVLKELKTRGIRRIWCNARTEKAGFYTRFGLRETDRRFTKGGKSYVIMEMVHGDGSRSSLT